ncbi:PAS domain-containing protein [Chitinophaga oryziterrae]|uniref:histidine kinase n=1 Tax=Chitinophaga oryziterrae TaxID=1031224 RepID=A0A6N8JFN0_9BACT|nr:PAS domain-containing protein [Chitinophaga oryziterrae]MVT43997.1 PAS domain-containing protein [Chitinophaga oryziterrae]
MNTLLQLQIEQYLGDHIPENLSAFLEVISDSYDRYEKERSLFEASQQVAHIGSWELDIINNHLTWSDETYRILGYAPQSFPATPEFFFNCLDPDDVEAMRLKVELAINSGIPYDTEHRIILPDGTKKIIQSRSEVLIDRTTSKPYRMFGTIKDITSRKKADEQLVNANNELRTLFENMQEAFFSVDMQTMKQLQMSPACEKVYGYPMEAFQQNPNLWFDLIIDEDKQAIEAVTTDLHAGRSSILIYRTRDKNGDIRWLESKLTPTLKDGILMRIDGATSDITKRKEAEIALRDSEYRFRCIIQHSSDAMFILNKKGEIIFSSDSLFRITGYTPEEVIGNKDIQFIHPDYKNIVQNAWNELLKDTGKTETINYKRLKKDGSYIWCEGVMTNLMHEPAVQGTIVNFRDITERMDYLDALRATNEDLKKSNMELDRFVYSVSHDLRAPLSSMLGVLQLIQSDVTDPSILSDLDLLEGSIKKLDGFILDILDYSKNSRLDIKRDIIIFDTIVADVLSHLKYMGAGNANIDIKVNINEGFIFYSDKSRIYIILNNLISNAIRYSNPDATHPFVEINIQTSASGVIIAVKDNGIGISENNQSKIFDIFYRVSGNSIGSGLGLYIVKETVTKLHGNIKLISDPGEGSEFIIYIPNS